MFDSFSFSTRELKGCYGFEGSLGRRIGSVCGLEVESIAKGGLQIAIGGTCYKSR